MDATPQLTEHQIQAWTDSGSFARGYNYYRENHILNPRRAAMMLHGQCAGSASEPYRVEALLTDNGIAAASCSCPVGAGGRCKHVVALLLTWLHQAETFGDVALLEHSLNQRDKEELVQIILKLVLYDPDLEPLLEMPLPGRAQDRSEVDAALVRRQVRQIIDRISHEWGASFAAAGEAGRVVSNGDAYARAGDWGNAAVVYAVVAQEILDDYENIYEEEGEFLGQVGRCARGLAECLEHIDGGEQRRAIIRSLFAVVRWDIGFGGAGLSDDAEMALIDETTSEERAEIAAWMRDLLPAFPPAQGTFADKWRQQELGGFLLQLQHDTLDDEGYLTLCRQTGRLRDAVGRLLQLGRVDEAIVEARQASDYELIALSSDIHNAGHAHLAENLLGERRSQTKDSRVLQQLLTWAQERNDTALALDLALQLFQMREQLESYQRLRDVAQVAGRWSEIEKQILDHLAAENQRALLIQIHLDEMRVDDALKLLHAAEQPRSSGSLWGHIPSTLALHVAAAAESVRPEAAIDIYISVARRAIDLRGRENYSLAAGHLGRVRDLLLGSGQQERWRAIIGQIRDENRRLPALKDELTRARLL